MSEVLKRPYLNDNCETCVHKEEDDHCRLLRCHCGAVVECSHHRGVNKTTPREQYLNYNIKLTEQLLGIKFTGKTLQEKEAFCERHKERRDEEVQRILEETYDEFVESEDSK